MNGEIVETSSCSSMCSYSGSRCVNSYGEFAVDMCSSFYQVCEDGIESKPIPIGKDKSCLNGNAIFAALIQMVILS